MKHAAGLSIVAILLGRAVSATAQAPGDTVVRMASAPVHGGVAKLVVDLSIGTADGAEAYLIGDIADIALGADGSIFAFDRQVPVIRQYDARGRHVRDIGRRGQGPGEYTTSSGIAILRDGRLLNWDTNLWRMNTYSAGGDFAGQWVTPSGSSGSSTATYSRAVLVDTAGRVVTRKSNFNIRNPGTRSVLYIRYRGDGTVIDTLHPPAWRDRLEPLVARAGGATTSEPVPFAPRYVATYSPFGAFITGYPDRYAFEIHQPGQALVSIRREVRLEPVSRSERAAARTRVEELMRRTDPQWNWNGPDIPAVKPAFEGVATGLDGRIWIAVVAELNFGGSRSVSLGGGRDGAPRNNRSPSASPDTPSRPAMYDVYEPDGRYLGRVEVPPKARTLVRRGDQVWGVALDDDDVPHIRRYRIQWGGR